MSKFNSCRADQQSTTPSTKSHLVTPKASRQKCVSPFPIQRCPSPLQKRLASSPLHVPLAIALKKLVSAGQENTNHKDKNKCSFSAEVEGIKNVLQEFAQSLYLTLQGEIYAKFNVEMKRIVLRYRDAEKLLAKVQQKITINADIIDAEKANQTQRLSEKKKNEELQVTNRALSNELARANQQIERLKIDKDKLERENGKLAATIEKLEGILLKRMEEKENNPNIGNVQNQSKYSLASRPSQPETKNQPRFSQELPYYSEQSSQLTNSYVLNINQLTPSHSPIRQRKVIKMKPSLIMHRDMNIINLKRCHI